MNRCPHRNDAPGRCGEMCAPRSICGDRYACFRGYCERAGESPIEEQVSPPCDTSAFFVSGRSEIGWRGDWAAWFYPEQNLIAAVSFCRYAPDEAPAEWLALDITSQLQ